jgi:hypothetical protein
MSSKKRRQTMEKFRREQTVKQRRADKLQKKVDARIAKTTGVPVGEATFEAEGLDETPVATPDLPEALSAATVERN